MFSTRSEYDRGVNTFSPDGRLFQVEYALGAIKLGSTAMGIKTVDGVILASEKRINSCLLESSLVEKILEIDSHIGCAMSGLTADARTLIDHARVECQNHFFTYNERMSVSSCAESIADLALDFSDLGDNKNRKKTMSRPFGVALLIGGVDDLEGPVLYCADPSGTITKPMAAAIGSAQEGADAMLQDQYNEKMPLPEAEIMALCVLRHVMEEKLTANNVELAIIKKDDRRYHKYTAEQVLNVINRLPPPILPTASTFASSA